MSKAIDIVGQRFGALVVLIQSSAGAASRTMCVCACDCGATRELPAEYLRRGSARDCGDRKTHPALWRGRGPVDLTGQRFGALVVVRQARAKPVYWTCACDCGASSVVRASNLTQGNTVTCGNIAIHPVQREDLESAEDSADATFDEIAEAIGTSRQVARNIYEQAMRKIRNNREALDQLRRMKE